MHNLPLVTDAQATAGKAYPHTSKAMNLHTHHSLHFLVERIAQRSKVQYHTPLENSDFVYPSILRFLFLSCISWKLIPKPCMCWKYASFSIWTVRLVTPASFNSDVTWRCRHNEWFSVFHVNHSLLVLPTDKNFCASLTLRPTLKVYYHIAATYLSWEYSFRRIGPHL